MTVKSRRHLPTQVNLRKGQSGIMERDGLVATFNSHGLQVTHAGQEIFNVATTSMVGANGNVAMVGAPAIVLGRLRRTDIGQMIAGRGIYFGIWSRIIDGNGKRLDGRFDLFTTDRDTRFLSDHRSGELATYYQDVQRIATLRNIHGHDGISFLTATDIHKAIRAGNYAALAKWHMPVREVLCGRSMEGRRTPNSLAEHRGKGFLKSTFMRKRAPYEARWYASCTPHADRPQSIYCQNLASGGGLFQDKATQLLSSRPVRAELRLN